MALPKTITIFQLCQKLAKLKKKTESHNRTGKSATVGTVTGTERYAIFFD